MNLNNEISKIIERDNLLNKREKEIIKGFIEYRVRHGISNKRVIRMFRLLKMIKKLTNIDYSNIQERDFSYVIQRIENSNYSDWTKYDMKLLTKQLFSYLFGEEKFKDVSFSWRKIKRKKPIVILSEDEIIQILENTGNTRDKLIISLLYELGLRPQELLNLRIKDIVFQNEDFGYVMVKGKTGIRRILTISSIPYLRIWLNSCKNLKPDYYLLTCSDKKLSNNALIKIVKKIVKSSGINKEVTPYTFRHSRATHLAKFLTEQQLKEFFGWSKDSYMPAIYVHLSGRDIDNAILRLYGLKEESKKEILRFKARKCIRCERLNPPDAKFCMYCGERLF